MAARFWVGGTGTADASDTTHWASSSGGAGGASVPGSSDDVTFDGSSGGGTVTINADFSWLSLTCGAFTGTITWATNNNNLTVGTLSLSGSGARTITMGSGTVTITGTSGTILNAGTITNLTYNAGTGKHLIAATPTGERTCTSNTGLTFNKIEIDDAGNVGHCDLIFAAMKSVDFVPTDVRTLSISSGSSYTVTSSNAIVWNGTLARPSRLKSSSLTTGVGTLSVGGAMTGQYLAVSNITKGGAGSIAFTNSFDLGGNTSVTITAPAGTSAGGGAPGIIS